MHCFYFSSFKIEQQEKVQLHTMKHLTTRVAGDCIAVDEMSKQRWWAKHVRIRCVLGLQQTVLAHGTRPPRGSTLWLSPTELVHDRRYQLSLVLCPFAYISLPLLMIDILSTFARPTFVRARTTVWRKFQRYMSSKSKIKIDRRSICFKIEI